jgi:hypothetical protein
VRLGVEPLWMAILLNSSGKATASGIVHRTAKAASSPMRALQARRVDLFGFLLA